jgi:hypothetical protein
MASLVSPSRSGTWPPDFSKKCFSFCNSLHFWDICSWSGWEGREGRRIEEGGGGRGGRRREEEGGKEPYLLDSFYS